MEIYNEKTYHIYKINLLKRYHSLNNLKEMGEVCNIYKLSNVGISLYFCQKGEIYIYIIIVYIIIYMLYTFTKSKIVVGQIPTS